MFSLLSLLAALWTFKWKIISLCFWNSAVFVKIEFSIWYCDKQEISESKLSANQSKRSFAFLMRVRAQREEKIFNEIRKILFQECLRLVRIITFVYKRAGDRGRMARIKKRNKIDVMQMLITEKLKIKEIVYGEKKTRTRAISCHVQQRQFGNPLPSLSFRRHPSDSWLCFSQF